MRAAPYVAVAPAVAASSRQITDGHIGIVPVLETTWLTKRRHIDLLRSAGALSRGC